MKKHFIILLAPALMLFAGCTKSDRLNLTDDAKDTENTETETETEADSTDTEDTVGISLNGCETFYHTFTYHKYDAFTDTWVEKTITHATVICRSNPQEDMNAMIFCPEGGGCGGSGGGGNSGGGSGGSGGIGTIDFSMNPVIDTVLINWKLFFPETEPGVTAIDIARDTAITHLFAERPRPFPGGPAQSPTINVFVYNNKYSISTTMAFVNKIGDRDLNYAVALLHAMYHIHLKETQPNLTEDQQHEYMVNNPQYVQLMAMLFPDMDSDFYSYAIYHGTMDSPVFTNLPAAVQNEIKAYFDLAGMPYTGEADFPSLI